MSEVEEEPLVAELGHKIDSILGEIEQRKEAYSHKDYLYAFIFDWTHDSNIFWLWMARVYLMFFTQQVMDWYLSKGISENASRAKKRHRVPNALPEQSRKLCGELGTV